MIIKKEGICYHENLFCKRIFWEPSRWDGRNKWNSSRWFLFSLKDQHCSDGILTSPCWLLRIRIFRIGSPPYFVHLITTCPHLTIWTKSRLRYIICAFKEISCWNILLDSLLGNINTLKTEFRLIYPAAKSDGFAGRNAKTKKTAHLH